ncbi:MAG: hypothetical protein IT384_05490 [Deltaproteobacteria bacterium]|nr:hypothetical protein [Deltaproteobacteria bacterium]
MRLADRVLVFEGWSVARPPLKPLHLDSLIPSKLQQFRRLATERILDSLLPGKPGGLKAKLDGTMMDGHHRIEVLRERGVDVDALPRDLV